MEGFNFLLFYTPFEGIFKNSEKKSNEIYEYLLSCSLFDVPGTDLLWKSTYIEESTKSIISYVF